MSLLDRFKKVLGGDYVEDMKEIESLKRDMKISEALGEDTKESKKKIRKIHRRYTSDTGPR